MKRKLTTVLVSFVSLSILFGVILSKRARAVSYSHKYQKHIFLESRGGDGPGTICYNYELQNKFRGKWRIIKAEIRDDNHVTIWIEKWVL